MKTISVLILTAAALAAADTNLQRADAAKELAEAARHEAMANRFAGQPGNVGLKHAMSPTSPEHCRWLAAQHRAKADALLAQAGEPVSPQAGCCARPQPCC